MKHSLPTVAATAVVSLLGWLFFTSLSPDNPLQPEETLLIVVVSAAIVLAARASWQYFRRQGSSPKRPRKKGSGRQRDASTS